MENRWIPFIHYYTLSMIEFLKYMNESTMIQRSTTRDEVIYKGWKHITHLFGMIYIQNAINLAIEAEDLSYWMYKFRRIILLYLEYIEQTAVSLEDGNYILDYKTAILFVVKQNILSLNICESKTPIFMGNNETNCHTLENSKEESESESESDPLSLHLWTIKSPSSRQLISHKGNSYPAIEITEGVKENSCKMIFKILAISEDVFGWKYSHFTIQERLQLVEQYLYNYLHKFAVSEKKYTFLQDISIQDILTDTSFTQYNIYLQSTITA